MEPEVLVALSERQYRIHIGQDLLPKTAQLVGDAVKMTHAVIIADEYFAVRNARR